LVSSVDLDYGINKKGFNNAITEWIINLITPKVYFELVARLGAATEGKSIDACPEPFLRQNKLRRKDGFNEDNEIKPI
jgi:hypothetical protein